MEKVNLGLLLKKYRPTTWRPQKDIKCSNCGDSGWIKIDGRNHRCQCLIQKIKDSKREVLPLIFRKISYKDIPQKTKMTWKCEGSSSVVKIPDVIENHKGGILLAGNKSVGKTALLCAQINAMIDRGFLNVFYITEGQLLNDLRGITYKENYQPVTPLWEISQGTTFHLAIDDIGNTPMTADRGSLFYSFINQFYSNGLSLSIATRFKISQLEAQWQSIGISGISSRFQSLMKWIYLFDE